MPLQAQLSELLRPQQLGDLTLRRLDVDRLRRMVEQRSMMNMLFYGGPGLGKTSAARVLMRALGPKDSIEINASKTPGIELLRRVENYASSVSMWGGMKICFIDEADHIPKPTQAALRKMIEDMSNNCRFLLAVNKRLKLEEALRSRLLPICFDIAAPHRAEVKEQLFRRYADVLARQGIKFTDTRLGELIGIYYPDLRSIANQVQFEFAYTDAY